jgi:arabinoxylan arabinofuranohydrolase
MKKTTRSALVLLSVLAALPAVSFALNPVIQTMSAADPASVTVATLPATPRPLVP